MINSLNKIFIESDVELLKQNEDDNTLFNFVGCDREIFHQKGYSIQYSASQNNAFARPWFPNEFFHVEPLKIFSKKERFRYRFSFIGNFCPGSIRNVFLQKTNHFYGNKNDVLIDLNNTNFIFGYNEEIRKEMNEKNKYEERMKNSKFVLCPRGYGLNSIRFFEALSVSAIPIFVGEDNIKFPLEWLIDWDKICIRISPENVLNNKFLFILEKIEKMSIKEINDKREYIYNIYNEYLSKEDVFVNLVREKIKKG